MNIVFRILITSVVILYLLSCNSSGGQRSINQENYALESDSAMCKSLTYTKYELPLSVDVYKFLKSKKLEFNKSNMHSLKEQDKYFTDIKRAYALGVYSSDLAYAAVFEKSQEAVNYFSAGIELANKLNIQDGYNSKTLDRAYEYIDDEDSLSNIASESYYKTCLSLEKENRDNILPLMVIASWIESMHILGKECNENPVEFGITEEFHDRLKHIEKLAAFVNDVIENMQNSDSKGELLTVKETLTRIQGQFNLIDVSDPIANPSVFKEVIVEIESFRNFMLE